MSKYSIVMGRFYKNGEIMQNNEVLDNLNNVELVLRDMLENERTFIGKSKIKEVMERLDIDY